MQATNKLSILIFIIMLSFGLSAQNTAQGVISSKGKFLGTTSPLSEIAKKQKSTVASVDKSKDLKNKLKEMPNFMGKKPFPKVYGDHILPKNGDPLAKKNGSTKMLGPEIQELLVLEGIDFNEAQIWPPDVNGDIGKNYYIQGVNGTPSSLIRIWDKVTGEVVETVATDDLWNEIGAYVVGDIIVIYDRMEERWLLSEISFSTITIAISQTDDPLGSYNIYEFQNGGLPDYPKFAVWDDAYYVTTNEFDGYNPVYAFDKDDLLTGAATVDYVKYDNIPKLDVSGSSFEVNAPVDFAGVNGPGETPCMAIRIADDEFPGVDVDGLEYFTFKTDFDDPTASSVEGPFFIPLAPFESNLCAFGIFECLEQKDGGNLSALQNTIMNRPQYRRFNDYESIVLNFSVDITGEDVAGIRWVELRKTTGTEWELHQEGTHSFDDGQNRWMGSIAQDGQGNTLLIYTLGGPDTYNSITYTGRRNSDPLGMMTAEETVMTEGSGAHPNARWGDYFAVKTDPLNEDEFWFTSEYVPADQDWATKVAKVLMRQDTIDGAVTSLVQPQSGDNLSATEAVEIQINNPGIDSIQNIEWTVLFEGAEIESGVYPDWLLTGESVNIPLTATVDMTALGAYDFMVYISVDSDQYLPNDTLNATRINIPSFDLQTSGSVLDEGCQETVDFVATYSNQGIQNVTSFEATITVNGTLEQTIEVTDVVASGASIDVTFIDVPVMSGTNPVLYGMQNLNGIDADQISDNNEYSFDYEVIENPVLLNLEFMSDFYGTEISWELVDDDTGDILYSKGNYPSGEAFESFDMCVKEGCYTFNLFDSFGDGWSLDQEAYLEIVQSDGVKVAILDNIDFGNIWTASFCVPKDCGSLDVEVEYEDATPGNNDAAIYINFSSAIATTTYSIDGGVTFQSSPLFTNLVPGSYEVVVDDGLGCTYTEIINVLVDIELYPDVEFTVSPNPTSGLFQVTLVGYDGPQEIVCHMINSDGRYVGNYILNKFSNGYKRTLITPDLPAGQYFLSIQNEDFNKMKSIIKQ